MIDYQRCAIDSHFCDERNDCVVVAVAIATQTPYQTVLDLFAELGRKPKGYTPIYMTWQALRALGYKAIHPRTGVDIAFDGFRDVDYIKPLPRDKRKSYTFKSIGQWISYPERVYLVMSADHIATWNGGKVEDWAVNSHKRIVNVWEVVSI